MGDGPPKTDEFDAHYLGTPTWEIGRPQPALAAAMAGLRGRVLDVGCGGGEHALLAASLGCEAIGVDVSPRAIALAEGKAAARGLAAQFVVGSALELQGTFDAVIDSALFHVLSDDDRPRYADSVSAAVPAGGRLLLLCFSEHEPGAWGPRRVTEAELRAAFADRWRLDTLSAVRLELSKHPAAAAWLAELTRL